MDEIDKQSQQRLADAIDLRVQISGSLRQVAKQMQVDCAYLSRLRSGEKGNPSDKVLKKLGLRKVISYEPIRYEATPLTPATKCA